MFETLDRLLKRLGVRRAGEHGATRLAQGWPATLLDHMLSEPTAIAGAQQDL
jgi:hypothetical protein